MSRSISVSFAPFGVEDVPDVDDWRSSESLLSASPGAKMLSAKSITDPANGCSLWLSMAAASANSSSRGTCSPSHHQSKR